MLNAKALLEISDEQLNLREHGVFTSNAQKSEEHLTSPLAAKLNNDKNSSFSHETLQEFMLYAETRFPDYFSGAESTLLPTVKEICEQALRYGLTNKSDLACAIDMSILYGIDFYESIWARDIFSVPELTGTEKMQMLRRRALTKLPDF
ncbi:hypothetical protein [Flocculibacter collagenilyticus]|uniref:hypothetical protein n=1 Tax=Flocculibacter collagenilyticus TaxID=2744479 RepID=UPI0018F4E74A|nr:hypothetical protein [Flocculibacter collagenilyticus]